MTIHTQEFQYGTQTYRIETGRMARQAHGSVLLTSGKLSILATAVIGKASSGDFFPLTINYQEKHYATGRIPGGFIKREGRPTERETLISRLIDRPIRPLFPKNFRHELQVVVTVLSADPKEETDFAALIAASAALAISGAPFQAPIAAAHVGFSKEEGYILNPSMEELKSSELDMVVAGTKDAVNMVESQANELSEEVMLGAVMFAHESLKTAISAIEELCQKVQISPFAWEEPKYDETLYSLVEENARKSIESAYNITEKLSRKEAISSAKIALESLLLDKLSPKEDEQEKLLSEVTKYFHDLEYHVVREKILNQGSRIDGRGLKEVRPIKVEVGVLPSAHGSALFTRGETQVLGVLTLAEMKSSQLIDSIYGEHHEKLMFQYNFPPFCVREVGFLGSPKRREIGHGNLARRGVFSSLPNEQEFPYAMRIVAEVLESNGSSSMASVCAASLAAMDAGVPVKHPVAGIAMGLVKEKERFQVLTDILGDEDHLGDMDFKVAGSQKGITALQMDIKIQGITSEIMAQALEQAKDGRIHILACMKQAIEVPREELSSNAPRIHKKKINPEKIREVIGKGGETIQGIVRESGAQVDIQDDGTILIYGVTSESAQKAESMIDAIIKEFQVGQVYPAKVVRIVDFGAFAAIDGSKKEGLIHVSQLSEEYVKDVKEYLSEGQEVRVQVQDIDRQGKIRLSYKNVPQED